MLEKVQSLEKRYHGELIRAGWSWDGVDVAPVDLLTRQVPETRFLVNASCRRNGACEVLAEE
jgi:hypothetical protein